LPSPIALRAFEAAARHLSFTAAAAELNVTQGAISRHVKFLEGYLGVQLFRRLPRTLELTSDGQIYYPAMREALDIMERATRRLLHSKQDRVLTLSVLPTLAMTWIIPELSHFNVKNPSIEVHLATSIQPADFRSEIDVAIRVGHPPQQASNSTKARIDLAMVQDWTGIEVEYLMPDLIEPVCSPAMRDGDPPLRCIADLHRHSLLHNTTRVHAWADWLHAVGADDIEPAAGTGFNHFFMTLQAAREGQGVACVPTILAKPDIAAGRLVAPFNRQVESAGGYHLLYRKHEADAPKIKAAREWLKAAAGRA
jgi:LysR family glycine cleavage system transcriptional activator